MIYIFSLLKFWVMSHSEKWIISSIEKGKIGDRFLTILREKFDFERIFDSTKNSNFNFRMTLGIEECVKLTRQASNDNERMAILLLIGRDFQPISNAGEPRTENLAGFFVIFDRWKFIDP